jgi:signal peptidase I
MAAILVMAAIALWASATQRASYVATRGVSMQPVYYAGDLVFVIKDDSYEVGQIAAYHGPGGVKVLHRIIGGDAEHGFTFKGDNNQSIDVDKPTADQLIGRAVLHVPKGGTWLQPMLSPTGLGMMGFLFVSSGAAVAKNRREIPRGRRKKRAKGMSGGGGSWATAAAVFKAVSRLHPALRLLAAATALCGVAGLALGVLGWMKPLTEAKSAKGEESMTFSYSAEVPLSAAYDGTVAYSPDPIFRKLANIVDLHLNYRGKPGHIEISGRLSTENGWHKTVELSQQKQFTTDRYTGTVSLDLNALEQHTIAAGKAIGTQMTATTVTVKAVIRHADGSTFEPQVSLTIAELTLTLAGGTETLVVNQSGAKPGTAVQERQIGAFGYELFTAAKSRTYAVFLILTALFGAMVVAMMALRHVPLKNRTQIQRRYPHLIVPVEPMASPPGKPVVIVDSFPALVKLAEKYGQMILTWTRLDGAEDFVVRDEGVLYRYRIEPKAVVPTPPDSKTQEDRTQVVSETTPLPALQLPSSPETSTGQPEDTATGEQPTDREGIPKKAAPRKRAPRTTAAKTAAAKTAATKAAPAKRPAANAPAKRTRAQAKPAPTPESSVEPLLEADRATDQPIAAEVNAEPVLEPISETVEPTVNDVAADDGERPEPPETTVDAETRLAEPAGQPQAISDTPPSEEQFPKATTADEPQSGHEQEPEADVTPEPERPAAGTPEAEAETTRLELASQPEWVAPETVETTTAEPRLSRSHKRANRRKGRSQTTPQSAAAEPTIEGGPANTDKPTLEQSSGLRTGPAEEAREAMAELAERNRPITEPVSEAMPEPIYDFLPAEKRVPSPPDIDEEPDA